MLYILTLTWNGIEKLTKLKDSLIPSLENIDYTWIIKDNDSSDNTVSSDNDEYSDTDHKDLSHSPNAKSGLSNSLKIKKVNDADNLQKKYSEDEAAILVSKFILENNLLIKFNNDSYSETVEHDNQQDSHKYVVVDKQVKQLITNFADTNNNKLIINILNSVCPKFYSELMTTIAITGSGLSSSQHISLAQCNSVEKVISFLKKQQITSSYRKQYLVNCCKQEYIFKNVILDETFHTIITKSISFGFSSLCVNLSNKFDISSELEYYYYRYSLPCGITSNTLHNIANSILTVDNFIVNNFIICLKIASYLQPSQNYNLFHQAPQIEVNAIKSLELRLFNLFDDSNNGDNSSKNEVDKKKEFLKSMNLVRINYERYPKNHEIMHVPFNVIATLVVYKTPIHFQLYVDLMENRIEIDSNNYSQLLSTSYSNANYKMFEYLLDNPTTISYNDDNVISQLMSIALNAFDNKRDNILIKVFEKDLPDTFKIEIINKAIDKKRIDLFESLISKCPNLGTDFQKKIINELIINSKFNIAEMLLRRSDISIVHFYDFSKSIRRMINLSSNEFLIDYIKQSDTYKSQIIMRLVNFKEKTFDIIRTKYVTLKHNLNSNNVDVNNNECFICLECYQDNDSINILQCGHYIHKLCYNKLESKFCPYCNIY